MIMQAFRIHRLRAFSGLLRFVVALATGIAWPHFIVHSQSSEIKFDRITSESTIRVKGLSQNSAYSLLQDYKGFIWIGTWDGLNKYDGYSFTIYNKENGLSHTTINSILEDDEKNIWIGTDDGLNRFDRSTGTIEQFLSDPGNPNTLSHNRILHLSQDREGFLWISTAYGLNRFDKTKRVFKVYNFFERDKDSLRTNCITCVEEDQDGMLWIGTHNGIHRYNPQNMTFKVFKTGQSDNSYESRQRDYINDLVIDRHGNIYAATRAGLFILNPGIGVIHHFSAQTKEVPGLSSDIVNTVFIDKENKVWIGTNDGLDVYDPVTGRFKYYRSGSGNTTLSNNDILSIIQDRAGTIWVGTYNGLNKADQSPSRFTHFFNDPANPESISDNIIYSIIEDDEGLVWLATFGGVNIFDRSNDRVTLISHRPGDLSSLTDDRTRGIAIDKNGKVWVGTVAHGLNRIDPQTLRVAQFRHNPADPSSISDDEIFSLSVDRQGRLLVGTGEGLDVIDVDDGNVERRIKRGPRQYGGISDNVVWCVNQDSKGNYWLGTANGLNLLDSAFNPVKVYLSDPKDDAGLHSSWIFSVHEDRQGIIWIGTMGGGLSRLDPNTGQILNYDESDGLPNNVVYATVEDDENSLWISTNRGISRFHKDQETFVNYDTKDGIQGNEFNAGAYYKNRNGELYFGGMNGFNVFHPREITLNQVPPKVVLTRFSVLNETIDTDLEGGEVFDLGFHENVFSIEFSALDFTNPAKNAYRYRLENYDNDWVFTLSEQRRADYRKVSPGSYRFVVNGSNNDGIWSSEGTSIMIIVRPPWWQTWFFRLSTVLLVIISIWAVIYFRTRAIRRKHVVEKKMLDIEKQVFELEQKALQLQMNPHFIFNSLNAIQNFVLSNDTDKAVNYLAKFSYLMRMILANSTSPLVTLKDELKSLTYYLDLEQLRFDNKFEYRIEKDPSIDEGLIVIPPMLLQPYAENAIIHGFVNSPKHGILKIILRCPSPGTLQCIIEDNGIGREKAIEIRAQSGISRQPRGMLITRERLDILSKQSRRAHSVSITDLKDERGHAAGTRVEFMIQYQEI